MKKYTKLGAFVLAFLLVSTTACEKEKQGKMMIKKDCSGHYISFKNKLYRICNLESVARLSDGDEVEARFEKIKSCSDTTQFVFVCERLVKYKSWVEILEVEK